MSIQKAKEEQIKEIRENLKAGLMHGEDFVINRNIEYFLDEIMEPVVKALDKLQDA
jgi:hypothetical protein